MTTTTLITTFTNGSDALKLLLRSFAKHHPDEGVCLMAGDIQSDEAEASELVDRMGYRVGFPCGTGHAGVLDSLCPRVLTPFTLIMDFDVEVKAPFLEEAMMLLAANPGSSCVALPDAAPEGMFPVGQMGMFRGVRRINPCCVLFNTGELQAAMREISWGTMTCHTNRTFYEVGAMLRVVLEASHATPIYHHPLERCIHHYGQIGALVGGHALKPEVRPELERRYSIMKSRVSLYPEVANYFRPCPLRS